MRSTALPHLIFAFLIALSVVTSSPTLDQPLTSENALDDEDPDQQDRYQEFVQPDTHRMAIDVADALLEGLEDSLEECDIDPNDKEGSLKRCMGSKEKGETTSPSTTSEASSTTTTDSPNDDSDDAKKEPKEDLPLVLLKTAFLNLNEEMKSKPGNGDADIFQLLDKIEKVVANPANLGRTDSTIVKIPTDADLEAAVTSQDYESKDADFWNTIFSVSDKVAMGLLLRIKQIERQASKNNLKAFLEGSDEERLKILADTLKLNKRKIGGTADRASGAGIKRSDEAVSSSFVAYDEHGRSFRDPATEKPIKRSGFFDGDDHLLNDEEFEQQLKRFGFDQHFQADHPHFDHVPVPVARQSQEFRPPQAFDEFGRPIKRSGMDTFGFPGSVDQEVFGKLEVPQVAVEQNDVRFEFKPVPAVPTVQNVLHPEVPATESMNQAKILPTQEPSQHLHHVDLGDFGQKPQQQHQHDQTSHKTAGAKPTKADKSATMDHHLVIISVSSVVVLCFVLALFVNRQKLRRYFSKNVAYRRVD